MAKREKKVNPKEVAKTNIMAIVNEALINAGFSVKSGEDYGMTIGTIIVESDVCDVQIKPIVPKAGIDRYEKVEE